MMELTQLKEADLLTLLRTDSGATSLEHVMTTVVKPAVYEFYKNETFCSKGAQQQTSECSWNQMVYGQWATGVITDRPMWNMKQFIDSSKYKDEVNHSYARLYSAVSMLKLNDFTPELTYYGMKSELGQLLKTVDFQDILANMDTDHLLNGQMWGDLLLNVNRKGQENFNTDGFKRYLKYATFQGGLFGILTEKTPRELIEGYIDPLVYSLTQQPVYMGGDVTNSPFLSIIFSPTNPLNNSMAFFQGDGDEDYSYLLTRTYSKWMGQQQVYIKKKDYTSLNQTNDVFFNPWNEPVEVNGTDGNQFHPDVQKDEVLVAFVNNFARTANFVYGDSDLEFYSDGFHKSIEMMNFYLDPKLMQNQEKNPDNKKYNTVYDGTINLNTVLSAQAIGTKGHFMEIDDRLKPKLP